MKLGVLALPDSWYFRDLQRAAAARVQLQSVAFGQLASGLESRGWVRTAGNPLDALDALLVRTMPPGSLEQIVFRMDALHRLAAAGTLVLNPPRSLEIAVDKYLASALLHAAGLPTPRTIVCQTVDDAMEAFRELGQDTVLKPLFGSEGRGITRVTDEAVAWRIFKSLVQVGAVIYQQQFIAHHGWDLRLLVIGDQILAMRRRNPLDWRTNISRGATGEPFAASQRSSSWHVVPSRPLGLPSSVSMFCRARTGRTTCWRSTRCPAARFSRCLHVDVAALVLRWLQRQLPAARAAVTPPGHSATTESANENRLLSWPAVGCRLAAEHRRL